MNRMALRSIIVTNVTTMFLFVLPIIPVLRHLFIQRAAAAGNGNDELFILEISSKTLMQ